MSKGKKKIPSTHLLFYFRNSANNSSKSVRTQHDDTMVYEIIVRQMASVADKKDAFLFVDSTQSAAGANNFKYYSKADNYPVAGDIFIHFWELDKWEAPAKVQFTEWYKVEDETLGNRANNSNEFLGALKGFIEKVGNNFQFICTDDSTIPAVTGADQSYIKIQYKKRARNKIETVQKNLLITGEFEATWELGLFPSATVKPSGNSDWTNKEFKYPFYFIESLKNIIRQQISEGGLTAATYANLLSGDDDLSREKYRYYSPRIDQQILSGRDAAMQFLSKLRQQVPNLRSANKLQPLTAAQQTAAWNNIEKELYWQSARTKFFLYAYNHKTNQWLQPTQQQTACLGNQTGKWANMFDQWRRGGRRLRPPELVFNKKDHQKYSFPSWKNHLQAEINNFTQIVSSTNILNYFRAQYGLQNVNVVAQNQRNNGNVCRNLSLAQIEQNEPQNLKQANVTANTIYNVFNDLEFKGEPDRLSKEFGFLIFDQNNKLIKGAHALQHYNEIAPYLQDFSQGVKNLYPEMCQSLKTKYPNAFTQTGLPKIYRFIIFTHGGRGDGLKFRPDLSSSLAAVKGNWLSISALSGNDGNALLQGLSQILTSPCIITLFACSTGGNTEPLKYSLNDKITRLQKQLKQDDDRRKALKIELEPRLRNPVPNANERQTLLTLNDQQRQNLLTDQRLTNAFTTQQRTKLKVGDNEWLLKDSQRTNLQNQIIALQKQNQKLQVEIVKVRRASLYTQRLLQNGGNPTPPTEAECVNISNNPPANYPARLSYLSFLGLRNFLGSGSFAETLRNKLKNKNIKADVWAHTDAGHTSRNARLRVFNCDGQAYDMVRLIFNAVQQPTEKQLSWWWDRGGENKPLTHQHAVKKAAMCSYNSINNQNIAFSLGKVINDFRGWEPK